MDNIISNNEIWATIRAHGSYAVSNLGRVKNTKTGQIIKGFPNSTNPDKAYLQVRLGANNYLVHVLVMETFSKRPYGCEVDHIDNNRQNNALSNLQWLTRSQNVIKAKAHSSMTKKILVCSEDGKTQVVCQSQTAAFYMTGVPQSTIARVARESLFMTKPDAPDNWTKNPLQWRNFPEPVQGKDGRKWYFQEVLIITDENGNVTWKRADLDRFPSYMVDGFKTPLYSDEREIEIVEADRLARKKGGQ